MYQEHDIEDGAASQEGKKWKTKCRFLFVVRWGIQMVNVAEQAADDSGWQKLDINGRLWRLLMGIVERCFLLDIFLFPAL